MFVRVALAGLERDIPRAKLSHYKLYGWEVVGANQAPEEVKTPQAATVDSGAITAKPRKKTAKSAETAPEAATVDLGNDISKGD